MKVAILYYRYLDMDGNERTIGGVETYLLNLAELCRELGWKPLIFQYANCPERNNCRYSLCRLVV